MAIVLTNGKFYIAHDATGKVIKVHSKAEAQDFRSVEKAVAFKKKCSGKVKGYYPMDTIFYKMWRKEAQYVLTDGKFYIGYDRSLRKNIVVDDYAYSVKHKYVRIVSILEGLGEDILSMSDWKISSTAEIECNLSPVKNLDIDSLMESENLFDIGSIVLSKRKIYLELELAKIEREVTDIYHAMEFYNYGVCNGFKMYKLMQERLIQRRKIKDEMIKIDYMLSGIFEELSAEQIIENIKGMDNRKYTPRVLKELFV